MSDFGDGMAGFDDFILEIPENTNSPNRFEFSRTENYKVYEQTTTFATHDFFIEAEVSRITVTDNTTIGITAGFKVNQKNDGRISFDDTVTFSLSPSITPIDSCDAFQQTEYDAGVWENAAVWFGEMPWNTLSINASDLFTSENPEDRSIDVRLIIEGINYHTMCRSPYNPESLYVNASIVDETSFGFADPFFTVVLDAPPTFSNSNPTVFPQTIEGKAFANISSVTVNVSNINIQYGGNIKEVSLQVGNQKVTRSDAGELMLILHEKGEFFPKITVTDSRNQTVQRVLTPSIVVEDFSLYASNVSAQRIKNDETLDDEGVNAVISATFNCPTVESTPFSTPVVYIKDPESSVNDQQIYPDWYENWDADDGFSNPISDWSTVDDGSVVYGHITDELSTGVSYDLELTPTAVISGGVHAGEVAKFNIPQSFYLLVGKPGGHGLGIGKKPSGDYLDIEMDIKMFLDSHKTMDQNLIDIASEYDDSIDENNEADLKALLYHALTWD